MVATLGYHRFGEYHYFTAFPEGAPFIGASEDEKYHTHESFAALVTGVHENYHLMQDMLQGFCLWSWSVKHKLATAVAGSIYGSTSSRPVEIPLWRSPEKRPHTFKVDLSDPLAKKFYYELDFIREVALSSDINRRVIEAEVRLTPGLSLWIPDGAYSLTTNDMLECHAALLTELYVSKLIAEYPNRFSVKIVEESSPLFRLGHMSPKYNRPLRMVVDKFGPIMSKLPEEAHPMYTQIDHGELYFLTAFLLDYALHVPPDPFFNVSTQPDLSAWEAILPPVRFLKLLLFFIGEMTNKDNRKTFTDERLYYSHVSRALATAINLADSNSEERKFKRIHAPNDPNLRATFFPIDEVTKLWQDELEKLYLTFFSELYDVKSKALQLRLKHPDYWFALNPFLFQLDVGLPHLIITRHEGKRGLRVLPFFSSPKQMSESELKSYIKHSAQAVFGGLATGNWKIKEKENFPMTLVPFTFVETVMEHDMFCRFGEATLSSGSLRCPLTESLGAFVPCKPRTPSCEMIKEPNSLPLHECMLRRVIESHFCTPDKFRPRGK